MNKNNNGQFKKGIIPWIKGKHHSPETIKKIKKAREKQIIVHSEKTKKKIGDSHRGKKSVNWKGGRYLRGGYIAKYCPEHPKNVGSYVFEHRLIMEEYLGRYLEPWEFVHHRNGIKDDNRIENLEIMTKKVHQGRVQCPHCHREFLIR
jgi:hypothetical protein